MYVIMNAIKNLGRNKGRNILTAIIVFAIILTTAVCIIINSTASGIISDYKSRFGTQLSINMDYKKLSNSSQGDIENAGKPLTVQQYLSYGDSDYLKSKTFSSSLMVVPQNLKSLDEGADDSISTTGSDNKDMASPKAKLIGSNRADISDDFKNGKREIISGEMYKGANECIISEQYAKLNGLSVGDKITISNMDQKNQCPQEFVITGIYYDSTISNFKMAVMNRNNEILVSFDTLVNLKIFSAGDNAIVVDASYVLKDPADLHSFTEEVQSKGLPKLYKITADEASYNKVVGPVQGLTSITNVFVIIVLILGASILVLLSILSIRERKYEIGVLRAMGMKKLKVAFGVLTESILITSMCLCVGLGVATFVAQPVADGLLQNQVQISEQNNKSAADNTMAIGANGDTSSEDKQPLSEIGIQLNQDSMLRIIFISLILAISSSLAGILFITKYEPMKILSERN